MATWHLGPLMAFDTETDGVDLENGRIVTATVANIRPGAETEVGSWLIAVDVDIPEAATKVHGITTEYARANGKPAAEVLDLVADELVLGLTAGVPLVGMKVPFDLTMLDRGLRRNGLTPLDERLGRPVAPVIDVFVLDKQIEPRRPGKRTLGDLCRVYSARHNGAHDATEDALAAARVAWRIGQLAAMPVDDLVGLYADRARPTDVARALEAIGRLDLDALHTAQVDWCRRQCDSLRAYFDRSKISHDGVPGDWPLIPYRGRP